MKTKAVHEYKGRSGKIRLLMLAAVLLVAAVLRFYRLGSVPASLNWDEVALGYNAYSVLKTGRDEYGTYLPLTLRSYDDYKPPLYMYLSIPSVAAFGLNEFATRLPSAVMGILAVAGTYFLASQVAGMLFGGNGNPRRFPEPETVGLVAAILLAVSPWHLQFSRIAFEANTGVTINIWMIFFLLAGIRQKSVKSLTAAAILAGLSLYAYHSERVFIPLLLTVIFILFRQEFRKMGKSLLIPLIAGILVATPLVSVFANPQAMTRLRGTSSLADETGLLMESVKKLEYDQMHGDRLGALFENRRLVWAKTLLNGYLSHFSLKWMFLTGDNPRHHAPDTGLLYVWELPFLLWGMAVVARRKGRAAAVLFSWVLLAPVAASPTTELPHAIRTLVFLPVLQVFTAVGILDVFRSIRRYPRFIQLVAAAFGSMVFLFFFVLYLDLYYHHMDREVSEYWQYGRKQAVEYAESVKNKYDRIVVSIKLEQPHMFFLFYTGYDPASYIARGGTASGGFRETQNAFGKYEFRTINWAHEVRDGRTLYIGLPGELPANAIKTIRYLDGHEAIRIVQG